MPKLIKPAARRRITVVGTPQAVRTTTVTLPAGYAVNDMILMFAYNAASVTLPTVPAAGGTVPTWTQIDAPAGANAVSARTAYCIANATNLTSGTWTGATDLIAIALHGQKTTSPIGGHSLAGGTGTNLATAAAATLTKTDGSSFILEFYGQGTNGTNMSAWGAAPAGYTRQVAEVDSTGQTRGSCCNSKDITTSDGAINQTSTTNFIAMAYFGGTIEILL
jgi:hypothetical protein